MTGSLATWPPLTSGQHNSAPTPPEPRWPKVQCRCLKAFMMPGPRQIQPGEFVTLDKPLCQDLLARGRVEIINQQQETES